ncbi:cache domain-containing protein [Desulfobacula toluolica]|uniref:Cache sensor protein, type 2 n=1 Tax=Desulfobacula toluolica (strain DSM 7467 / Tol2) TaxID=651182 RepID=K0NSH3_DESTT|nr:cache domain-containing protein [Desulfobacula toluolica]CCK81932.1 cache sensor protein, type 2 [Desulfobacula toluolica Tol2]
MKSVINLLIAIFLTAVMAPCVFATDNATSEEVVAKVKDAAAFLNKTGDNGLAEFMDRNGRWVWKDTYVWVIHAEKGTDAAHPIKPKLCGMQLMNIKDTNGKYFFAEFCDVANRPNGGWVDYMWPKVGEKTPSRKITYVLQVPNSPYQVAAGIYNDAATIDELNQLIQ